MAAKRMMPVLSLDGRALVKTVRFRNPQYIGDPINAIKIYNEKEVDELVLLDITASRQQRGPCFDLIGECASECFMPFSYGGGVQSIDDFARLYRLGVEKVIVNTACMARPALVREATRTYGATSVVAAVDYTYSMWRTPRVYSAARARTTRSLIDHCRFVVDDLGVGELLLTCVDRDGTWSGFDLPAIRAVATMISVPVIACGGAGTVSDITQVLAETPASAAAVGSMAVYQKKGMGVLINFPRRELVLDDRLEPRV